MSYIERALKVAAEHAGSRVEELMSDIRFPQYVRARWAVMVALMDCHPEMPNAEIGRQVKRHPATVLHGLREGLALRERDPSFARLVERVKAA